ncbi:MAG TPA: hypothetical protein PKD91_09785, partial [Bacteroidia bacterium]|nr:hypothetical protein [Bacteroidia bacterium]
MDFRPIILNEKADSIKIITTIVDKVRPARLESSSFALARIKDLITLLKNDHACKSALKSHLNSVMTQTSSIRLFTQSGIFSSGGFFSDLFQKIRHTILPPLHDNTEMGDVISRIFHKPWDHKWVNDLPDTLWKELMHETGISLSILPYGKELEESLNSILILSHRIVVLGLDPVLVSKIPEINSLESPFFKQNQEITRYIEFLKVEQKLPDGGNAEYKYILKILAECSDKLQYVKIHKSTIGASMGLTYIWKRLEQHLKRIKILLSILHEASLRQELTTITLFKELVFHQKKKNTPPRHISSNIGLLAYQVSEHAAKTGEHYISNDRKEYLQFFKYSLGGGFIVAFLVCLKVMISHLHLPPFNETLLNGLNYGIGFIVIHLCGFTLATKQPAMTASTLAGSLEGHSNDNVGISNLAQLIVKISRTQFVSFAGNLLMVFPTTWALSYAYLYLTGHHLADPTKANKLIHDLNFVESLSLWYAAIAGVLLFTAGLISGYFDNKTVFNHIPERLVHHPALRFLKLKNREKFAQYIGNNLGSLSGNFILGLLLASMAFLGFILGLPLDVRHVTFVTGNFGLGLECLDNYLDSDTIIVTIISIVAIGFVNFIVSFGLAIFTAIRARNVKFRQTWKLINLLKAYFFTYPLDFFLPPKTERQINLIDDEKTASQ